MTNVLTVSTLDGRADAETGAAPPSQPDMHRPATVASRLSALCSGPLRWTAASDIRSVMRGLPWSIPASFEAVCDHVVTTAVSDSGRGCSDLMKG